MEKPFWDHINPKKKTNIFLAARDRVTDKYERVRSVSNGTFRYVYNFEPEKPKYQESQYRKVIASTREILAMRDAGTIKNSFLLDWFKSPKPQEELYYTAIDPDEVHDIARDPIFEDKKNELKAALFNWLNEIGDLSEIPEKEIVVDNWWKGKNEATATPTIVRKKEGILLEINMPGVSIGYRVFYDIPKDTTEVHIVKTWDFPSYKAKSTNGTIESPKPWSIYKGNLIPFKKGQYIQINAMRIGYTPSELTYFFKLKFKL